MKYSLLNKKDSALEHEHLEDLLALYKGGKRLQKRLPRFFQPSPREHPDVYQRKLNQAKQCYNNYFAQGIDYYADFLFGHRITVDSKAKGTDKPAPHNSFYEQFKEDCDGIGTDRDDFLKTRFREALVTQTSIWALEKPIVEKQPDNQAQAEEIDANRITVKAFCPTEVLRYQEDSQCELNWIVLHRKEKIWTGPFDLPVNKETWWIYDRTSLQLFELAYTDDKPPNDNTEVSSSSIEHGFKRVPIVCLELDSAFGEKALPPQLANLRATIRNGFNLDMHANPLLVIKGIDDASTAFSKTADCITLDKVEADAKFIELPSSNLQALQAAESTSKTETFRAFNLKHHADEENSMAWRSGLAKTLDRDAAHVTMKAMASAVCAAVQRMYNLTSEARGEDLEWSAHFDHLSDVAFVDLVSVAKEMKDVSIPSETFKKEFAKQLAMTALPDLPESKKQEIREQIDAADFEKLEKPAPPVNEKQPPTDAAPPPNLAN